MADLKVDTLFESDFVRVADVRCYAPRSGFGADEWIESPRLIFPRRGLFTCRLPDRTVTADSNGVLLFNAADLYRVSHPCEGGDDCSVFVFPLEVLFEAFPNYGLWYRNSTARPFSMHYAGIDAQIQYGQRLFHHALRQGGLDALGVEEAAGFVLNLLVRRIASQYGDLSLPRRDVTPPARRALIGEARALLASQPEARLSLNAIARQLHYSPFHLARLFRAEVGTTLHQYQLQLRLALALERIAQGEDNLSRLALDLGFNSHSHFSACFRRCFGCTPSQIRARLADVQLHELSKILIAS